MINAASTSNPSLVLNVGEAYPYPSHVIAPNFVTVKLSGRNKYNMWKTQMMCLLESHHMFGFIDGEIPCPELRGKGKVEDLKAWLASDSLVKGWILGSLSEESVNKVVNHLTHQQKKTNFSAKDLWNEVQRSYGPLVREQAADPKSEDRTTDGKTRDEKIHEDTIRKRARKLLYKHILKGTTKDDVIRILKTFTVNPWDKITNNGNTVLHAAVGSSTENQELLKELLRMTPTDNTLLGVVNSEGSTVLHVAAIGGNIEAVNLLVERSPELLSATDKGGHTPLALSISNMYTNTSRCLYEHMKKKGQAATFSGQSGEDLVVLAISCQDFSLARMIIQKWPNTILSNNDVLLTTLAQNFPRELNFWERDLPYGFMEEVIGRSPYRRVAKYFDWTFGRWLQIPIFYFIVGLYAIPTAFVLFLKAIVHPFIKDTSQVFEEADNLLSFVSDRISNKNKLINDHRYNNSIFEATRRNASTFIREIMGKFQDAIWSTNEDGHNFIQYSVINRSEKIYNLLYEMSDHKNIYKTIKDYSGNNLLHLAARLAPTHKLNQISGAALQIQREIQWFKEVERFVCPLNRSQKNSDDETPEMIFTREHKDLVLEGENWIKKTAESYTITAALIITIVFAAAITVPGGNNQDSGIPIFTNNTAFIVFAISDAISLFTAVTSLLMFLSILTARFAEQDFLYKLPTKLIIGLTMLFISTTAMIVAFGATLFLVFGQNNLLMLIPIGVLTLLPITSFVTLQFPLIVELVRATYCGGIFVRERDEYFY